MDNKKIYEKVKMKIAISKVKEEDIVMKKNRIGFGKGIGIAACLVLSTTGVVFAANQIINKFGANSSDGVQTAVDNGYYYDVNTEYKEANGISANIDSFILDDTNFDISINLKFNENYDLKEMLSKEGKIKITDLKVVNENEKKVFATKELESEEMTSLYKTEQEARENYDGYAGAYGENFEKLSDNELRYMFTASGNPVNFPESNKLIITFNKIVNTYTENNERKNIIYNGEWSFEIDVPSKMSKSNITEYNLASISDSTYKFDSARCSNTAFRIYLRNCSDIKMDGTSYVENENGEKFYPSARSDGDGCISIDKDGNSTFYNTFNLTNFDATNNITVHLFKNNGNEVIIKLTK